MLTNPQGVPWPGWNRDAFRMRWRTFVDRAYAQGAYPKALLADALGVADIGWQWWRHPKQQGVMVSWEVNEPIAVQRPDGQPLGEGVATSWHTTTVYQGSEADTEAVLGLFVWLAAGALQWD